MALCFGWVCCSNFSSGPTIASVPRVLHHSRFVFSPYVAGRYLLFFRAEDKTQNLGIRLFLQKVNQGWRERVFSHYKSV